MEKKIDIPFGAKDSELKGWEYTIPEGFAAEIKDGKVIVREKESENERIRKGLIAMLSQDKDLHHKEIAYLENLKDASKAIEAMDRIYKYIEVENVANAHDMNDSNPNKKYYCGWNDALGKIAGILQDVYSDEKLKETLKSANSMPSNCASSAKLEDIWHKVADSFPDSVREVICKDAIGNFFIGRYYKGSNSWKVSMYDDVDKSNEDNPPVVMWCDIPSEKHKEQKSSEDVEMIVMSPYEAEFCQKFCDHAPDHYSQDGWKLIKNYYAVFKEIVMRELAEQNPFRCIDFDNEFENQVSHLLASVLSGEHEYNEGFVKYAAQSLLGYAKNEMKPAEWSEEDKKWLSGVYFAIDHSMYSEDERRAMKKYIDSLRKNRKTCDVDEFSLTLRNCLSADSELTKWQADTFARAYGEDLYKVALGEVSTGLDKEDIEEYRNETKLYPDTKA